MKKRKLQVVLFCCLAFLCILLIPENVSAAVSGDYEYTVLDDGTAEITKYNGTEEDLVIPDSLDGHKVKSIGDDAFYHNEKLKNVTISNGVEQLNANSFSFCYNMENIQLPESLYFISYNVFYNCSSLKK